MQTRCNHFPHSLYEYFVELSAGCGNPDIRDGYGYGYPSARPPSHPDFGGYGLLADIRISAGIRIPRADIRIPGNIRMPTGIRISADIRIPTGIRISAGTVLPY